MPGPGRGIPPLGGGRPLGGQALARSELKKGREVSVMLRPRKRLTRKQIKEDKLVIYTAKATHFLRERSKIITGGVLALVAIVVIAALMIKSKQEAEIQASGELARGVLEYQRENYEAAIEILEAIEQNFPGTPSAGRAVFFLANAYYFKGDYLNAQKYYQKYLDDYGDDDLTASSAMAGVAACLENQGQLEEAARWYERSAKKFSKSFLAPQNLIASARCYLRIGNKEKARELLERLLEKYPKSTVQREAQLLLATI